MYFFCILIGFIAGIATLGKVQFETWQSYAFGIWSITACFIAVSYYRSFYRIQNNSIFTTLTCVLVVLSAFSFGHYHAQQALLERLSKRTNKIELVDLVVYVSQMNQGVPLDPQQSVKQRLTVIHSDPRQNYDVLAYVKNRDDADHLKLGHYYRVKGKAKPAHSYAVEGVFDQEKWLLQQNIMGTIRVREIHLIDPTMLTAQGYLPTLQSNDRMFNQFKLSIEQFRLEFRRYISQQPLVNKGLLLALVTGDESLLSPEIQMQFKAWGISHLLAISGPHVLIFAVIFCFILNRLINWACPRIFLKISRPYFLVMPFLLCVLLYTALVGFEIPALRTCLTVIIISLALLFNQKLKPLQLLVMSAGILLYFDPFSILSAAFWLSYGACFILIRVYQTVQKENQVNENLEDQLHYSLKYRLWQMAKILIDSQWKIFIALLPLVALIFQQVSWVSPLINLIAVPLLGGVIVPIEMMGMVLSLIFQPLGLLFFHIADGIMSILLWSLNGIATLFDAQLSWLAFTPMMILSLAIAIFILYLPRGILPKSWALICVVPLFISSSNESAFQLSILDVGQGQSIFIHAYDQNLMIDTGGSFDESKFSIGENVIIPYLMNKGITRLDQIWLSHLDQDHAGAYEAIKSKIKMRQVYSSEKDQRFENDSFEYCQAGQSQQIGAIKISILSPMQSQLKYASYNRNEMSCVVYVQVEQAKNYKNFLIMGDAGWEAEYQIMKRYPDLKVDVIVLGHHGSKHSSSYDFLKHYQPKLAIASAGFDNRYHHPNETVIKRLIKLGIPFKNTIQEGTINFSLTKDGNMALSSSRDQVRWLASIKMP